jgi:PAS domain S-box-containing protein
MSPASVTESFRKLMLRLGGGSGEHLPVLTTDEEAREAAAEYRLLFEHNPQPMWVYDEQTLEIFEVNEAAVEQYGYSREEFLSMTLEQLRPAEDIPALRESVAQARSSDRSGPWKHIKRGGTIIEVDIVSHDLTFHGRRGRLVLATDVTERMRLQRQLAQVQRLESLGQLAGGVAHDFNNLLGAILNYTAFVREELADVPDASDTARWESIRSDVEQVEKAARRATGLTRQLLAFARREVVHPEVISLNDVVTDTEELLRRTLGEHIQLGCSLDEELWATHADPSQMSQVLVNLAVNARDAMPGGGTLMIETANVEVDESYAATRPGLSPGPYVRLRVSDDGAGMDAATAELAFEPFFTTKPKGEGTGLGLATIHGIVNQAGGRVGLYSEPGVGTTCTVMLPATEAVAAPQAATVPIDVGGNGEVILLVEDEDAIREVARRILSRHGYAVLSAGNGPDALQLATDHDGNINLLLTDVIMPRMLGKELAERLLATRPETRVLYMSGYAQPILDAGERLPDGMLLIEKPFSEHTLLAKVQQALSNLPSTA